MTAILAGFPLAGAAVWLNQSGGKVEDLRIALTAVNPYPHRVKGMQKFQGAVLDENALDEISPMKAEDAEKLVHDLFNYYSKYKGLLSAANKRTR